VHCALPRAVLRPTPSGRSLNTRSRLVSTPVRIVYGCALDVLKLMFAVRFLSWLLLQFTLNRRRMSNAAGPQSSIRRPVAGMANGPSVSLRFRPKNRLVKICIRCQSHRGGSLALAGARAPVAATAAILALAPAASAPLAIITGPAPPPEGVALKLRPAPKLR